MSKIQDALGKIQRTRSRGSGARDRTSLIFDRATELDGASEETGSNRIGSKSLTVDFDALRLAGLLPPKDQERQMADEYRLIKRPLLDNAYGKGAYQAKDAKLIMVAGALPGDGKTSNCVNLALSMAVERDTSVLLVDADVAKPHISELFGVRDEMGLIDLLGNRDLQVSDVAIDTDVPGLSILPAGHYDEHATELLASRRMEELVSGLSERYPDKVVIFDSPPLLPTSEARVLASLMGQIVVVVCAGHTPRNAVVEAVGTLDPEKAINVILCQTSSGFGGAEYGRYGSVYGYGYRRGTEEN